MARKYPLFHAVLALKFKNQLIKTIKQSRIERYDKDDIEHMYSDVEYRIKDGDIKIKSGMQFHHAQGTNYTLLVSDHEPILWDVPCSQELKKKIFHCMQQQWANQWHKKTK